MYEIGTLGRWEHIPEESIRTMQQLLEKVWYWEELFLIP